MVFRFSKWGNSLAVRVPSSMAREIGAVDGAPAHVVVEDGRLVITPTPLKPRFDLQTMIEAISDENVHDEIATGAPVGKEYW